MNLEMTMKSLNLQMFYTVVVFNFLYKGESQVGEPSVGGKAPFSTWEVTPEDRSLPVQATELRKSFHQLRLGL